MHVVDDFITPDQQQIIKNMFLSRNFPWYFNASNDDIYDFNFFEKHKNNLNFFNSYIDNVQMTHAFFSDDKIMTEQHFYKNIESLIESIENKFDIKNSDKNKLLRVKANLLLPSRVEGQNKWNVPHIDYKRECNGVLYYVNDCDGDTIIFKENLHTYKGGLNKDITISPKMGRAVFFNSSTYHTSSCPINSKYRIVINFVYI